MRSRCEVRRRKLCCAAAAGSGQGEIGRGARSVKVRSHACEGAGPREEGQGRGVRWGHIWECEAERRARARRVRGARSTRASQAEAVRTSEETSAWPSMRPFCSVSKVLGTAQPQPMSPTRWPRRWNSKRFDWKSTGSLGDVSRRGDRFTGAAGESGSCGSVAVGGGDCSVVYTRSWSSSRWRGTPWQAAQEATQPRRSKRGGREWPFFPGALEAAHLW